MKKALSVIITSILILMLASCATEETKESRAKTDTTKETTSETTKESESETTSGTTSEVTISDTTPSTEMTTETESETTVSHSTLPKADPTQNTASTEEVTRSPTSSIDSTRNTDSPDDPTHATSSAATVRMPDVMGMNYEEATNLLKNELQAAGFSKVIVSVGWAWGDGNPDKALTVMSQKPAAGTSIEVNDSSITVIIMVQEYGIEL